MGKSRDNSWVAASILLTRLYIVEPKPQRGSEVEPGRLIGRQVVGALIVEQPGSLAPNLLVKAVAVAHSVASASSASAAKRARNGENGAFSERRQRRVARLALEAERFEGTA